MRGCIKQRSKNKNTYSVIIELGKDPNTNNRRQKWYTIHGTKKDAEQFLTEKLRELDTGTFIDGKDICLKEYLDYWHKEYCIKKLKTKTYESYKDNIKLHITPVLGNIKLKDLIPLHLQNFYSMCLEEKNLSSSTTLYLHRIIHCALNKAMKWQLIARNVADNVEPPKRNVYEAKVLDNAQLTKLIEIMKNTNIYIPFMLAISTGMRRGEIAGLTWENVDFLNNTISIAKELCQTKGKVTFETPKTKKSNRTITIPPTLAEILQNHKESQNIMRMRLNRNYKNANMVCSLEDGSIMLPDFITHKFEKVLKKNNFEKIRFHDLRHTHASLLLMQGVQPKAISERLGHSNIGITMDLYSHTYEASNREIANNFDVFLQASKMVSKPLAKTKINHNSVQKAYKQKSR